ncbi:MAG: hypothetical protein L0Z62_48640 [Gemmataceae bacterium]|nr:hypothetical protein [Gemmataceae bacterium]
MSVEVRCPGCGVLLAAEEPPGGRCPGCTWEAVGRALRLERVAALLAFWASLSVLLGECGFFLLPLRATNPPWWLFLFIELHAVFLVIANLLVLIALVTMVCALLLHCAVPPLVRLREPALATIGCVSASGLAVIAGFLVIVVANPQGSRGTGGVRTLLMGAGLLLWYLGQVVHVVYLRRLARHFNKRRLADDLAAFLVMLLVLVPAVAVAEIVLLQAVRRASAEVGLSLVVLILQVPVPILIYWFARLVPRVRALIPQKPQEIPGAAPDSVAAAPREGPSP